MGDGDGQRTGALISRRLVREFLPARSLRGLGDDHAVANLLPRR
jgi:hypothetical protein